MASTGGRRLKPAALAAKTFALEKERTVSKGELRQANDDAQKALKLRPSVRMVLSKLVACWGEHEWDRLLVWPSNEWLMAGTGLSERAVRNAIRELIELQLVVPKDSANGKRFAVRDATGKVIDAYGLDLTPLYVRRGEWKAKLAEQKVLIGLRKQVLEEITICRRATEEALTALALHFPDVDRSEFEHRFEGLRARSRRLSRLAHPSELLVAWQELRSLVEKAFLESGNGGTKCRHIDSESKSPSETCDKGIRPTARSEPHPGSAEDPSAVAAIVEACPTVRDYHRPVRELGDIIAAGRYLRASLGAHESAWQEAVAAIGPLEAAASVLYVLQLYADDVERGRNQIRNPGGYFRTIVRMVKAGKIDLWAEIRAMRRRRMC
ncbi:plasmid replication protein RepC [Microvirga massiliensis]|uniref:plasmid replication protein RepC n=1 Tax=Microvirga massiliensis TaxID=1033741 RepID=UPI00062BBE73|nr:plasmid replication protein RepC [Microvirga massiliensis]